jgi:prolyl-tRNA editing enzyme YbaK/EbsC (Cys-tRNA(Pro) deacylase)
LEGKFSTISYNSSFDFFTQVINIVPITRVIGDAMIPSKVQKLLEEHDLKAIEFKAGSTPTAPLAAKALGVEVGQIAKSLLFIGKNGKYYMVLCSGDRKVSGSKLKWVIGVKSRMANAEEIRSATGFSPGGVCPFGVEGIDVLLDKHLNVHETIYPAAGTDASGVPMTFEQLKEISKGRVCDLTVVI